MSSKNRNALKSLPSAQLQQRFMELCTRYGQEAQNETRAQQAQVDIKKDMDETEAAFIISAQREKEAAQAKANDEARKLHVAAKTETPAETPSTPATTEGQSA